MREEKYTTTKLCSIIATIMLLFVLLVASAEAVCFGIPNWWEKEYTKHNSLAYVNGEMSMSDAVSVTDAMLNYCIGKTDSLEDVTATINGEERFFFTEREKLHLADCRVIFKRVLRMQFVSIVLFAVCLAILLLNGKKRHNKKIALQHFEGTTIICLILVGIIAILAIADFGRVFDAFHMLLFNNDFWILSPYNDEIVNLMRPGVFYDTAALIGLIWFAVTMILFAISHRALTIISRIDRFRRSHSTFGTSGTPGASGTSSTSGPTYY